MKKNIHVVPYGEWWAVKMEGVHAPLSLHGTQEEARRAAVPIAKRLGTDVVIHRSNGKIRDRDSYGSDPFPPRDMKH